MRWLRILLKVLAGLIGVFLLIMGGWLIVAGPPVVMRVIRYGNSRIDHHRFWPARKMAASPAPFHFEEAAPAAQPAPADLDALLEANDTIAFLALKNDRLILERYFQNHGAGSQSMSFSMAKSITSMLVGAAIADGYIQSVEQPVTDFIPELSERGFGQVTLAHLLAMMSGSSYVENDNPFGIHVILNYTPALEQRILGFRMQDPPGTVWRYKSGDNALLALVLSRALAPKTITEYTQERLWAPLGMEYEGLWSVDHEGDGLERTWCCLAAAARDFLKLGRLYLHEGQWQGQQIIPAEWVRESTQVGRVAEDAWDPISRQSGTWNYGYQWWLVSQEEGSYLGIGKDGQYLYVNPAKDAVVVRLGWSTGRMVRREWIDLFEAAIGE